MDTVYVEVGSTAKELVDVLTLVPNTFTIQNVGSSSIRYAKLTTQATFAKATGSFVLAWQEVQDVSLAVGDRLFVWTEDDQDSWLTVGTLG